MGKRTRAASEDYESIANKIRKLEQELMRTRRRDRSRKSFRERSSSSSSDTSRSSSSSRSSSRSRPRSPRSRSPPPDAIYIEGVPIPSTGATAAAAAATDVSLLPTTSAAAAAELHSASVACSPGTSTSAKPTDIDQLQTPIEPTPALDHELLLILGEDPSQIRSYGENIQPDLAIRLQHIASTGLPKDIRKELVNKYLPPGNCALIEAPTLNPEVVAAVTDAVIKRDKGIEFRQRQRTSAISAVAKALTLLMSSEPKNTTLIQTLMDAIKLMGDSQNTDSILRRGFVLSSLKKDLKDQLQATKIDKLLFSEGLAETLKAAKAIFKSGADMKQIPIKQTSVKNKPPQKHLNWRAPLQNYRQKGNQRTKEPAYKDRPASSSKPSSRPAQNRNRNRR